VEKLLKIARGVVTPLKWHSQLNQGDRNGDPNEKHENCVCVCVCVSALPAVTAYSDPPPECEGVRHTSCDPPTYYDYFGRPALYGAWAAIGRRGDNGERDEYGELQFDHVNSGAVYMYHRSGGEWTMKAKLRHPNPESGTDDPEDLGAGEWLGESIAINDRRVVAGAWGWNLDQGRLAVFHGELVNGEIEWDFEAPLVVEDGAPGHSLGGNTLYDEAVAISGDTVAGGAPYAPSPSPGSLPQAGYVALWNRDSQSGWPQTETELIRSSTLGYSAQAYANFGASVAMDGDWMVIGEPGRNVDSKSGAGRVYVVKREQGNWTLDAVLESPDGIELGAFGVSVSISGVAVAVGAYGEERAYVYQRVSGSWVLTGELEPTESGYTWFGKSVSISPPLLIVGAPSQGDGGLAYVYQRQVSGTWDTVRIVMPESPVNGEHFGDSVALLGDNAIVFALRFTDQTGYDENGLPFTAIGAACFFADLPGCSETLPECPE
jgi:hypothetical protein